MNNVPITTVDYTKKQPFYAKHCVLVYGLHQGIRDYNICNINGTNYWQTQKNIDSGSIYGSYGASFSIFDDFYTYTAVFYQSSYGGGIIATSFDLETVHVQYGTAKNPYTFTKSFQLTIRLSV